MGHYAEPLCRGHGLYATERTFTARWDRAYKPGRAAIIFHTSGFADTDFVLNTAMGSQVTPTLAHMGRIVGGLQLVGDVERYGNAANRTRIGELWTKLRDGYGADAGEFVGIGVSKGATALLNYARHNPGVLSAAALFVPGLDVQDIYDNYNADGGVTRAQIETAYGGRPSDADNPAKNTDAFEGTPIKIWDASNDPLITQASVEAFVAATGAERQSLGAVGHSAANVDPADVRAFLEPYVD